LATKPVTGRRNRRVGVVVSSLSGAVAGLLLAIITPIALQSLDPARWASVGLGLSMVIYIASHLTYTALKGDIGISMAEGVILSVLVAIGTWMGFYPILH